MSQSGQTFSPAAPAPQPNNTMSVQAEEAAEEEDDEEVSAGLFSFGTRRIKARAQQQGRTQEVSVADVSVRVVFCGCFGAALCFALGRRGGWPCLACVLVIGQQAWLFPLKLLPACAEPLSVPCCAVLLHVCPACTSRRLPRLVLLLRSVAVSRRRHVPQQLRSAAGVRRRHRRHVLRQQRRHAASRCVVSKFGGGGCGGVRSGGVGGRSASASAAVWPAELGLSTVRAVARMERDNVVDACALVIFASVSMINTDLCVATSMCPAGGGPCCCCRGTA